MVQQRAALEQTLVNFLKRSVFIVTRSDELILKKNQ